MRPHVSPFAYQNFIDRTQPNWEHAYYGANLERLTEVKRSTTPTTCSASSRASAG